MRINKSINLSKPQQNIESPVVAGRRHRKFRQEIAGTRTEVGMVPVTARTNLRYPTFSKIYNLSIHGQSII